MTSTQIEQAEADAVWKLDVIIPVFDPGLGGKNKEDVLPNQRQAEANLFAWKMKKLLEKSGKFSQIRVTPNEQTVGDLYVMGKIVKSTATKVEIAIHVADISGRNLTEKSFSHKVKYKFFNNPGNKGKDAYQPVFAEAADHIVSIVDKEVSIDKAKELKNIADLRFATLFSNETFGKYLSNRKGKFSLNAIPAENDVDMVKIRPLRVRDQLFVDEFQAEYQKFHSKVSKLHNDWQRQAVIFDKEHSKKGLQGLFKGLTSIALIAAAVIADKKGNDSVTAAAGAGAALMAASTIESLQEAKKLAGKIEELGHSLDIEVEPRVANLQENQAELAGTASEQFAQWRAFLKKIYELEKTPDRQL